MPARTGLYWWESFSADEVRRDWERAAQFGIAHFLIHLTWRDFQPDRQRLSVRALHDFETALRIADDQCARVMPVLFAAVVDGLNCLPSWARAVAPGARADQTHDLITRPAMRDAEDLLMREIVGEFGRHPAVGGWVVGDRLAEAVTAATMGAQAEWLGEMAEAATRLGEDQPLLNGVSARALVHASVPMDQFHALGIQALVHADWSPTWAQEPERWVRVLTGVAGRLSRSPVIASVGRCTDGPGCTTPAGAADDAERSLEAIDVFGGGGSFAADLFDYVEDLRRLPPYVGDQGLRSRGLFSPDGSPKDAARIWADWCRDRHSIRNVPPSFPDVDPDEWRRRPEPLMREVYEELER
ncbi:MAG TPA: hypothetical protein VFA78_09630 [Chloroflexota bacterium]|nr:hypothetical protein [Chloroflexota bacterium]